MPAIAMRITLSKNSDETLSRDAKALSNIMYDALLNEHRQRPFTNSLRVSEWLARNYPNPRVRIITSDNGSPIQVVQRNTGITILSIHCTPTF